MLRVRAAIPCAVLGLLAAVLASPSPTSALAGAATCHGMPATIVGGSGDEVVGTPGADVIVSTDSASIDAQGGDDTICFTSALSSPTDISAGPGRDLVDSHGLGADDEVDLGTDDDTLIYRGTPDHGQRVAGGGGHDEFAVANGYALRINQRSHLLTPLGDDSVGAEITGFVDFEVKPEGSLALMGGVEAESVTAYGGFSGQLGSGDDHVLVAWQGVGPISGQQGNDTVILGSTSRTGPELRARVLVELPSQVIRARGDLDFDLHLDMENVTVQGVRKVRMVGDPLPNRFLTTGACNTRLDGGGGRDVLQVSLPTCSMVGARLFGEGGSDRLMGSAFADLLDGGPGFDIAEGGPNTDRCRLAEVRRSCELPR
jgi:Ca2+-binding RTX toxin-like protein